MRTTVIAAFAAVLLAGATSITIAEAEFRGPRQPNYENPGIMTWFCLNKPWSLYGSNVSNYHEVDQSELKGEVIKNCDRADDSYLWPPHGNVYVLVLAPSWNNDKHSMDTIGNSEDNEITCSSSDGGRTTVTDGRSVGMSEIGYDTGIFGGRLKLAGELRTVDGVVNIFGRTSSDVRTISPLDRGSMCTVQTQESGGFTWSWEYSSDAYVTKSGGYTYREGNVKFSKDVYTMGDEIKVVVDDVDLPRWSFDTKAVPVQVWSDTDTSGIEVKARFVREYWKPLPMDGTHYGTIMLNDGDSSGSNNDLRITPGDNIYAAYYDYTLPLPYSSDGCAPIRGQPATHTCEHIKITNFAKVLPDRGIKIAPAEIAAPTVKVADVIGPSEAAMKKYTSDGMYKVVIWWDTDGELRSGTEHKMSMIIMDSRSEKIRHGIDFDLNMTLAGRPVLAELEQDESGVFSGSILFDMPGHATAYISGINGDSSEGTFEFQVDRPRSFFLAPGEIRN
ncbi:hypothetical protein CENSYa_0049 [Cenarchaeum symbiosum A]|uniref:Uncharacterized protein n=1 Tax=Cenarchaeum symbiosum (strain A) TaxID=414004 RepID=A0RTN1_CENSY|nr:hypothetical protein CENSYa_0049 [Cenarchaeum symbiosum A]